MQPLRMIVASMGGNQSPIIETTGELVDLPSNCIALIPNPGCKFTDIRSDEFPSTNLAAEMNIVDKDISDPNLYVQCPIMVNSGKFFTKANISAGSYKAVIFR